MFKLDTHVHTSEVSPCGNVTAIDTVNLYKESDYNGIIITDHYYKAYFDKMGDISWDEKINNFLAGYRAAKMQGDNVGVKVFLGAEFTFEFSPNDYLAYGITEAFLKDNPMLYNYSMVDFYKVAKKNGLLVCQAHPFRPYLTPEKPELLDGIEVYNGNPRHNSQNNLALEYAIEHNLKMLSGSDCHEICDVGRGGIVLNSEISSSEELLYVLENERVGMIREGSHA